MERYNILITAELKDLKCSLYNHIWLFLVIGFLNIIFFMKIYFLYKVYIIFYLICTFVFILLIPFPLYPLIHLYKKSLNSKKAIIIKKISFINIIICSFFGILINVIIFINIYNLFTFYKECPYNFSYNDIANIFDINTELNDKISECENNRCVFLQNSKNPKPYSYLCNFDSSYDFESIFTQIVKGIFTSNKGKNNNTQIKCNIFDEGDFNNEEIIQKNSENFFIIKDFYEICSSENIFYNCHRHKKPKKFNIEYNFSCPTIYDNIFFLILGIISIIFNYFVPLFLYIYIYLIFKKLHILYQNAEALEASKNSTNNSSHIKSNINGDNTNEVHYETIIIEQKKQERENNQNIINNNNFNKSKNESLLSIKRLNNSRLSKAFQEMNINSERNKINSINLYNYKNSRNIASDNDNNSNNSIKFKEINYTQFSKEQNNKNNDINLSESNTIDNNLKEKYNIK